jgi:hypothetical protein
MKNKKLSIVLALLLSIPVVLLFTSMNQPHASTAARAVKAIVKAPVQAEENLELTDAPLLAKPADQKDADAQIRFCVYKITAVANSQPGNPLQVGDVLCVYPCPPCSNPMRARVFRGGVFLCNIKATLIAPICSGCPIGGRYARRLN